MFICEKCATEKKYCKEHLALFNLGTAISRGRCELCEQTADCVDIPSNHGVLHRQKKRDEIDRAVRNFKPQIVVIGYDGDFATFLVKVQKCPCCHRHIAPVAYHSSILESYDQHVRNAGWVLASQIRDNDGNAFCTECVKDGHVKFTCVICKKERWVGDRHSTKGKKSFCKYCYETVSAKEWDAAGGSKPEWEEEED